MLYQRLTTTALALSALCLSGPVVAQEAETPLGEFDDWQAMHYSEDGAKV